MKKIVFISLFSILTIGSFAQGNLQFSGAKYIKFNKTFPYILSGGIQIFDSLVIVPPGKVWKVESAGANSNKFSNTTIVSSIFDGVRISNTSSVLFPIWLPAGSYRLGVAAVVASIDDPQVETSSFFSIIEFNLVP